MGRRVSLQPLKETRQCDRHKEGQLLPKYQMTFKSQPYTEETVGSSWDSAFSRWSFFSYLALSLLKLLFAWSLLLCHKAGHLVKLVSKGLRNKRLFSSPAKRLSFGSGRGGSWQVLWFHSIFLMQVKWALLEATVPGILWIAESGDVVSGKGYLNLTFPFLGLRR